MAVSCPNWGFRPIHAIVNKPIYDVTVRGDAPPLSAEMIARVSGWLSSGATPEEAEAALKVRARVRPPLWTQSAIPVPRLARAFCSHGPLSMSPDCS